MYERDDGRLELKEYSFIKQLDLTRHKNASTFIVPFAIIKSFVIMVERH